MDNYTISMKDSFENCISVQEKIKTELSLYVHNKEIAIYKALPYNITIIYIWSNYKSMNEIQKIRQSTGLSQSKFSAHFGIPITTLQDWEHNRRTPPAYVINMIKQIIQYEKIERKEENVTV